MTLKILRTTQAKYRASRIKIKRLKAKNNFKKVFKLKED